MRGRTQTRLVLVAAALTAAISTSVAAMNWTVTPRLSSSVTYSDNVDLEPDSTAESGTILRVSPGVSIEGEGRRTQATLSYGLNLIQRSNSQDGSEANHTINARADSELVKRTLFVEASVDRREAVDSLLGPVAVDNTTGAGNTSTVTTASFSPYLVNRFGSFATSTLRYTHDRVHEEDADDSYSNGVRWDLASGPTFGRVNWGLNAEHRRVEGVEEDAGVFRSASARLGYQLGSHWRVSATGGYEDNDYNSAGTDLSGSFWDVGATWSPNQRTEVEARYGRRYFGETQTLRVQHSRKRTVTSISYTESISSTREDRLVRAGTVPIYIGCTPATDPNCQPADEIVIFNVEPVNEFFIQRRAQATINFAARRNSLNLSAFRTEREFEVRETTETQTGGNLTWGLTLGRSTTFTAGAGYSRNEFEASSREDDLINANVSLSRRLGDSVSTYVQLRHQRRDSTDDGADYRENAATVGVSASF